MTTAMSRRGRPRFSDEERAERRAELTERAMAAVREGGGDQSLDEIAAHIGVSKPVLYDTFGSRTGLADALALALAERTEAFVVERFGPTLPDGTYDVSVERVIELIVTALVFLVDQEPELYTFITSAMRGDRRGMLDNSLVAVVRERIRPVTELATPGLGPAEHSVLTDGMYGLVLATLESWRDSDDVDRDVVVGMLTALITNGMRAIADGVPPSG